MSATVQEVASQAKAGIRQQVIDKLQLSIGEASRVCGISVRQLNYWTEKGLVKALDTPGKKRYDFRALERIALIKRSLNDGYSLDEAAVRAVRVLASSPIEEEEAHDLIFDRLAELEHVVSCLRQQLSEPATSSGLTTTAHTLVQLNLRALFDERPRTRASADELAHMLGVARDQVRLALQTLVNEGAVIRQGRLYRRSLSLKVTA